MALRDIILPHEFLIFCTYVVAKIPPGTRSKILIEALAVSSGGASESALSTEPRTRPQVETASNNKSELDPVWNAGLARYKA